MGTSKRLSAGGEGDVLRSWHSLNSVLNEKFNEDEVRRLLEFEASNQGRARFLNRLHGRLSEMVRSRERAELLRKAKDTRKRSKKVVKRKAAKRAKPTAAQRPTMKRKPEAVLAPKPKRVRKPKPAPVVDTAPIENETAA